MNKKILFTPVGGTDPVSNFKDASILHICRIYRPDEIYLFFSKEMYENHLEDNRYLYCLDKLGELLGHKFEYHIIVEEGLIQVQEYDLFYDIFKKKIEELRSIMDGTDTLYLNTSSGTPAMKSALFILATISDYPLIPLQVATPLAKINIHLELSEKYDAAFYWENNEDNKPGFEKRCTEVKSIHLLRLMKLDLIKKHITAFDYNAAMATAETIKDLKNTKIMDMVYAAKHRSQLNISQVSKLSGKIGWDILPVKDSENIKIFEYAMLVWLKIQRGEYADFVRSLTPLIINLEIMILKKECKLDVEKLTTKDEKNKEKMFRWNKKLMNQENPQILKVLDKEYDGFKFGPVYSAHINILIQAFSQDINLREELKTIAILEKEIRNIAAHTITSVSDKDIVRKTGFTSKLIFQKIKYMFIKAGMNIKENDWNTYINMNDLIKKEIDKGTATT